LRVSSGDGFSSTWFAPRFPDHNRPSKSFRHQIEGLQKDVATLLILVGDGRNICHRKTDERTDLIIAKKSQLWFGILDAGKKTSPVVRDPTLETGDPQTIYLFNLNRGAIREYRVSIAQNLLRELTEDEQDLVGSLEEAFNVVRAGFVPRYTPNKRARPRRPREIELPEIPDDADFDIDVPAPLSFDDAEGDELDTIEIA